MVWGFCGEGGGGGGGQLNSVVTIISSNIARCSDSEGTLQYYMLMLCNQTSTSRLQGGHPGIGSCFKALPEESQHRNPNPKSLSVVIGLAFWVYRLSCGVSMPRKSVRFSSIRDHTIPPKSVKCANSATIEQGADV